MKKLSHDTRNVKRNFNSSFAVPLTASVPTNGGSSLEPVKTEENNNLKYIIGIAAAVLFLLGFAVAILYCLLRRRCDERIVVHDPPG